MSEMRVLSLWQPWGSAIAYRKKQYETRSWQTSYRGLLAIHAAKRKPVPQEIQAITNTPLLHWHHLEHNSCVLWLKDAPLGAIVAVVRLADCVPITEAYTANQTPLELAFGNWQVGRFAWLLDCVYPLDKPIAYKGAQGLRRLNDAVTLTAIAAQIDIGQEVVSATT